MMAKKIFVRLVLSFSLVLSASALKAEELIMMRVTQTFPETMVNLQSAIIKTGYKISRVQRVDIGLTKSGFKTDKYRVVFFGKPDEIDMLTNKHSDLIPYLPLKISIFSENNDTILISNNPLTLGQFYKDVPSDIFNRWNKDINAIFQLTNNTE